MSLALPTRLYSDSRRP